MKSSKIISRGISIFVVAALSLLSTTHAGAQILWYNGDDDGVDSYFSVSSGGYTGFVYDDFKVNSTGGWSVTGVSGNFLDLADVTQANWEIRSGVSSGNGGTLVAGSTSPAAATVTSSTDSFGNTLYHVVVNGLDVSLAQGTYWLGLQPISSTFGYVVTTSGANAVGSPPGNDGDSFQNDNFGDDFAGTTKDFSLAVIGATATAPEPTTLPLMAVGFGLLLAYSRVRLGRMRA